MTLVPFVILTAIIFNLHVVCVRSMVCSLVPAALNHHVDLVLVAMSWGDHGT